MNNPHPESFPVRLDEEEWETLDNLMRKLYPKYNRRHLRAEKIRVLRLLVGEAISAVSEGGDTPHWGFDRLEVVDGFTRRAFRLSAEREIDMVLKQATALAGAMPDEGRAK